MKIVAKQTRRCAQDKPYLPDVLVIKGHIYDTDDMPKCVVERLLARGLCEEYISQQQVETLKDNPVCETPEDNIAQDDAAPEDVVAPETGEDNDGDVEDEEDSKVEEVEETEEAEASKSASKKIIRRNR